jgi:hypothetical protein
MRNDRLIRLHKERDQLLRLRGKNLAAAGLAGRLRSLATQARATLDAADDTVRRKIVDLLDLRVEVIRWEPCETCDGNGLLARLGPFRYNVAASGGRRREPIICPDCLRTRQIPVLRISARSQSCSSQPSPTAARSPSSHPSSGPFCRSKPTFAWRKRRQEVVGSSAIHRYPAPSDSSTC